MNTKELRSLKGIKNELEDVYQVNIKETLGNVVILSIWDSPNSDCRVVIAHKTVREIIAVIDVNTLIGEIEMIYEKMEKAQQEPVLAEAFIQAIRQLNHISNVVGFVESYYAPNEKLIELFEYVDQNMDFLTANGHFEAKEIVNDNHTIKSWFNFKKQFVLTLDIYKTNGKVFFVEVNWFMIGDKTII